MKLSTILIAATQFAIAFSAWPILNQTAPIDDGHGAIFATELARAPFSALEK